LVVWVELVVLVVQVEQKVLREHRGRVVRRVREGQRVLLRLMREVLLEVMSEQFVSHLRQMRLRVLPAREAQEELVLRHKQISPASPVVLAEQQVFYILGELQVIVPLRLLIVIIQQEQLMELRGLEDLLE
jgi:hypothetical protein